MNKKIFQYTALLLLILFGSVSGAQDRRTLDVKVTDIIAQMPARDLTYRNQLMEELIDLGAPGFNNLQQRLTPPGEGDDTAVRFAINSMARYASEFGREKERNFVEANLLETLEYQSDFMVKTFLLNQLNLVAGNKSVVTIKKYLINEQLVEPATQTLLSVKTVEASRALMEALPDAGEMGKITIIKALGELQCMGAAQTIANFTGTTNQNLQKVSLAALANIGDPGSYDLLLKAAKNAGFDYEPTNAAEAFINYAGRLGEKGEVDLCQKALKSVIKENRSGKTVYNYATALSAYSKYFGYKAMPLLLEAVESNDKALRMSVLNISEGIGGIAGTREWIDKAGNVSSELKSEIIYMLGNRGDELAVPFVKENLNSPDPPVREEALTALAKLGGEKAAPVIIKHLAGGRDISTAKNELLQLLDHNHLGPVGAMLDKTSGSVKAALIDIIAAKAGNEFFNEILELTKSQNSEERASAFNALKFITESENLDDLISLLLSVEGDNEIRQAQAAVIAAARDNEAERTENGKLLQALEKTNKKERIIVVLPEIGGDIALKTVTGYFNNSGGKLKDAAFEALTSWKDYSAAKYLYSVCQTNKDKYGDNAFKSFVRQVNSADIPHDQKLLQFRKIMPYANDADAKKSVINSIGNLKTFLSLIYLEQFLDDNAVQQAAARSVMKIALPDNNGKNSFTGDKVSQLLNKVTQVIKGEESEYDIINIKNYLEEMPREVGFVSLFNGKNLDGWQGLVGNPLTRQQMSAEELTAKQKEANEKMLENWSVKDNTIVFNGHGANLCTIKEYGDFEMIVDWRITKKGDSGIYLRGTPQIQIWDTSRVDVGAQVGSGGLYNNKKYESKPLMVADNPVGEWNTFHITMIGENVTVFLNGELVVDNVPLENYWDRDQKIFEKGPVELQAHGTNLAFRDIFIKEIKTSEIGLTEQEINDGFVSLFNGKNLDGWQGNKTDYIADNGELLVRPERGGHGNLYTAKEYSDFIFRFEFQLTPGANNGLGIRAPLEGDAAYDGMELQILDNTAPVYANLQEYQYHGSVYGVIPAKRGFLKPVGEWNEQEVLVKGNRVKVTLNGTVILDGDIAEASKNGTRDGRDHPGLKRDKGYIGFLGHGSELKFRNIRIKDLGM